MEETIIAIGALGGSGTRVCAEILIQAGVFMGNNLNIANDNLLFTRLFKNPNWFESSTCLEKQLRFDIFKKCMTGDNLTNIEKDEIIKASLTNPLFKTEEDYLKKSNFVQKKDTRFRNNFWGWKEPNTQIYINQIARFLPEIKYIHVIRHGLDIAFTKNYQQMKNWGYKFGIHLNDSDTRYEIAKKQLSYWITSNNDTIKNGKRLLNDNFYLLNFQELCEHPSREIKKMMEFVNIEVDKDLLASLSKIPQIPVDTGRFLNEDISIFTSSQMEEVKKLGFDISVA